MYARILILLQTPANVIHPSLPPSHTLFISLFIALYIYSIILTPSYLSLPLPLFLSLSLSQEYFIITFLIY